MDLVEDRTITGRRGLAAADDAGATLVVIGLIGAIAWAWQLVRSQIAVDQPVSLGDRIDLLATQTPMLLLAGVLVGLGIGLRNLDPALAPPDRSGRERPAGLVPFAVAALVVFIGAAAIVGPLVHVSSVGDLDAATEVDAQASDLPSTDDLAPIQVTTVPTTVATSEPTYVLELHSDGCGVFRSGEIGDDLTWVFKDEAGFQVLGRNAAGETQYRYYRSGTYTVTLEAWGGGHYVAVSNELTVTC